MRYDAYYRLLKSCILGLESCITAFDNETEISMYIIQYERTTISTQASNSPASLFLLPEKAGDNIIDRRLELGDYVRPAQWLAALRCLLVYSRSANLIQRFAD